MARRNQHNSEQIRAMALAAAERIVRDEGCDALNARRIAADMDYTVGTLYSVFVNMADLTLQLKTGTLRALARHLQAVPAGEPAAALEHMGRAYLRYAAVNHNRWRQLFEPCREAPEATLDDYRNASAALFKLIESQFARLAPAASNDDCRAAARAVGAGVHGICQLHFGGTHRPAEMAENEAVLLIDCFVRGWPARQND